MKPVALFSPLCLVRAVTLTLAADPGRVLPAEETPADARLTRQHNRKPQLIWKKFLTFDQVLVVIISGLANSTIWEMWTRVA